MAVSKRQISRKATKLSKQKKFQYDVFKKICRLQRHKLNSINILFYTLLSHISLSHLRANLCYKLYEWYFLENVKLTPTLLNFSYITTLKFRNATVVKLLQILRTSIITLLQFCAVNIAAKCKYFKFEHLNAQRQTTTIIPSRGLGYYPASILIINAILTESELQNFHVFNTVTKRVLVLSLKWDRLLWSYNVKSIIYKNWNLFRYQRNLDNQFFLATPFRTKFFILKTWLWRAYAQQFFLWIRTFFLKLKHLYLVLNRVTSITYKLSWIYHYGFWKLLKLLKCGVATKWALINIVIPFKRAGFFVVLHHFLPKIPEQRGLSILYSDLYFNIWRLTITTRLLSVVGKSKLVMLGLNQNNKNLLCSATFFLHRRSYHNDFFRHQSTSVLFFSSIIRSMTKFNLLNCSVPHSVSTFFINFTILFKLYKRFTLKLLSSALCDEFFAAFPIFPDTKTIPKILFLFMALHEYAVRGPVLLPDDAKSFSLTLTPGFVINSTSCFSGKNDCNYKKQIFNLGMRRMRCDLPFSNDIASFYIKKLSTINILDSSLIKKLL